ncbi:MAG: aldo/keto reductase [Chloroflexota bacterium]|nr:MAG: aldo/keto reductase [Chloroflexota bacterium]
MIPQKPFGRTGHLSTRTIFGAAALGSVTQEEADWTLELLLKYGINHIDTAASYGESELRIGPWMREHRKDFFLATKTEKRTYQGAKDELRRSLERLQVEQVDLWQMHFLVDPDDLKTALAPGGALEAFIEAKDEGLVRYLGVTGHGLIIPSHLETCLDNYSFDSILLPFNFIQMQNPFYVNEFEALIQRCKAQNVAVQTIKSISRGPKSDGDQDHATWYEPLVDDRAIANAVHWVLGHPDVFLNTVGDIHLLKKVLKAADTFESRPPDEMMLADVREFDIKPLFI